MPLPTAVAEVGRELTLFYVNLNTAADIAKRYLKGEQTVSDKQAVNSSCKCTTQGKI